jgi:3-hydroxyisobutyrate dehydrogenase-like beta-hydroxyacid dehydrogenase
VVHTCLANDAVALDVYQQLFAAAKKDSIFLDHSTLYLDTSDTLQELGNKHEVHFLSCPVFGAPAAAKTAQLLITIAGDPQSREQVKSYLIPTLGKGFMDCGDATRKTALLIIVSWGPSSCFPRALLSRKRQDSTHICFMNSFVSPFRKLALMIFH